MNQTKLLIGSLSNDLYRAACMIQRGSLTGAKRFVDESQRWTRDLQHKEIKPYIRDIVADLKDNHQQLDMAQAEKYLMYSVLLQNYALHLD